MFTSNLIVFEELFKDKTTNLDELLKSENIKLTIKEILNIK